MFTPRDTTMSECDGCRDEDGGGGMGREGRDDDIGKLSKRGR